ncbi:DUF4422 domain-containing protein [Ligilactobacillus murinus]|uniref:DUF4422 domain-containing protein n=1 Tax=Ligilactobacillus murinus TaxID=1622 RepID=UPI00214B6F80|nr:DUF4422 domain-containing protein [Ligilactobacillus murinus]MCR1896519.1 DUF4422 domain-containing protein [Ligilactobacillus murinus]
MKAEVYVVSHKKTKMPKDEIYLPLQVGKDPENFKGFLRDNTGDNISAKNENYCELTAQYWATKNRTADVKGLVHYRRFFSNGKRNFFASVDKKYQDIMTSETLQKALQEYDMILPKKRNYYIETSWSHYEHVHHIKDLETTRQVLVEKYPDYVSFFDQAVKRRSVHMFNMMIAKSELFDAYTTWLIDVLSEVEKRTDISDYTPYEKRIYGFISELLLDVWVDKNQISYVEYPVMFMGKQNWVKKISSFLIRKITGKPSRLDN